MTYAIVIVATLIADQFLKYYATIRIVENTGQIPLIPGFIHLSNIHNTGAAFSIFPNGRWFFVALCVVIVAAAIYALARNLIRGRAARWGLVLVISGALGNCIDRVIVGHVVDMLEFEFIRRFPVFNIADILITVGAVIGCVALLVEKPEEEKPPRRASATVSPSNSAVQQPRYRETPQKSPEIVTFAEVNGQPQQPPRRVMTYTQPENGVRREDTPRRSKSAPAKVVQTSASRPEPAPIERKSAPVKTTAASPEARTPAPEAKIDPAPAEPTPDEFNLDDILAEFRDP